MRREFANTIIEQKACFLFRESHNVMVDAIIHSYRAGYGAN